MAIINTKEVRTPEQLSTDVELLDAARYKLHLPGSARLALPDFDVRFYRLKQRLRVPGGGPSPLFGIYPNMMAGRVELPTHAEQATAIVMVPTGVRKSEEVELDLASFGFTERSYDDSTVRRIVGLGVLAVLYGGQEPMVQAFAQLELARAAQTA